MKQITQASLPLADHNRPLFHEPQDLLFKFGLCWGCLVAHELDLFPYYL